MKQVDILSINIPPGLADGAANFGIWQKLLFLSGRTGCTCKNVTC